MCLKWLLDFFSYSDVAQNIKSKRKLNMDFVIWTLNVLWLNMFQSMFQIFLQMTTYVLNKFLPCYYYNQISCFHQSIGKFQKKRFPILCILQVCICFLWMIIPTMRS
jgi:hypothetical protein